MAQALDRDGGDIGSMGSLFRTYRFRPEEIPILAEIDWSRMARRVFIDPVTGLIALLSPSSEHERYAGGVDRLVDALGRALGGDHSINLHSTRWRLPGDPEHTGAEPDACYYLGKTAEAWRRAHREGRDALAAFEEANPPDLVVEVERSHGDETKPGFYRALGAREMWRLDVRPDGREMEILDLLRAERGPAPLPASSVLPLCTPEFVLEAVELASRGELDELDELISRAAASAPHEEWRPPEPPPFHRAGGATE